MKSKCLRICLALGVVFLLLAAIPAMAACHGHGEREPGECPVCQILRALGRIAPAESRAPAGTVPFGIAAALAVAYFLWSALLPVHRRTRLDR